MRPITDPSVSLLARLRHLAQQQGLPVGSMLLLYVQQGFLARLDGSAHTEQFVVKGGLSLFARYQTSARPTQDLDLAASSLPNTPEAVAQALSEIVQQPYPDGLNFGSDEIQARVMQIESKYTGVAAQVTARVGRARQTLPIDVSFGNVITPGPVVLAFPRLLLPEAVQLRVYPLETVIAEKFAALVELGLLTTRMKDVYDLHLIAAREAFDKADLKRAISRSFAARSTPDPEAVLSESFVTDPVMNERWRAFLRRTGLDAPDDFAQVMRGLVLFLRPVLPNVSQQEQGSWSPTERIWLD